MTFLIYLGIVLVLAVGLVCGVRLAANFGKHGDLGFVMALICGILVLIFTVIPIVTTIEYREFERSFYILSDYYEILDIPEISNNNNYIYTVDIIQANHDLANWQAKHQLYGIMSVVPDRVMNISPIGLR